MTDRLDEIEVLARRVSADQWKLVTLGGDVKEFGHYVVRPAVGAVAVCPKISPIHSGHPIYMKFIAEAGRNIPWLISRIREQASEIERLRKALRGMMTFYGMDEDRQHELCAIVWDKAREAMGDD